MTSALRFADCVVVGIEVTEAEGRVLVLVYVVDIASRVKERLGVVVVLAATCDGDTV